VTYISRLGAPFPLKHDPLPKELQTGDTLGSFTAPYPVLVNNKAFNLFNWYHSTKGINTTGITHTPIKWETKEVIRNLKAVFAGDIIRLKNRQLATVIYSEGIFTRRNDWRCYIRIQQNPITFYQVTAERYEYLQALYETQEILKDFTSEVSSQLTAMIDGIVNNLALIQAPSTGGALIPAAFIPAFNSIKTLAENAITLKSNEVQIKMQELESKEWKV